MKVSLALPIRKNFLLLNRFEQGLKVVAKPAAICDSNLKDTFLLLNVKFIK